MGGPPIFLLFPAAPPPPSVIGSEGGWASGCGDTPIQIASAPMKYIPQNKSRGHVATQAVLDPKLERKSHPGRVSNIY